MYKKIIFYSLLFFAFVILIDKAIFEANQKKVPHPEKHIRESFELLRKNDKESYSRLILSEKLMKGMKNEYLDEIFAGMPGIYGDAEIGKVFREAIFENSALFREYCNYYKDNFKEAHRGIRYLKDAKIEKVTWKLISNSDFEDLFICNAKIYVRTSKSYYCIKYKNCIYYQGKWFAGIFTDVDEIDESDDNDLDYFPDMYQAPSSVEEYIYKSYEESEFPNDGYPAEDAASESSESMEED